MHKLSSQDNFIFLAIALVFLLLGVSIAELFSGGLAQRIVIAATVMTLAVSVLSIKKQRLWFRTGLGFTVAIIGVAVAGIFVELAGLHYLHLSIMLAFFIFTAYQAARQVLFSGSIDGNKIIGSICIYLLLGLIWAILYLLIAEAVPGAFNGIDSIVWYKNFSKIVYFSFVSLASLGYGEITPVFPIARFLAYMEAIIGQFYMAILVASLIGIRITGRK
jgi:hypothetical protein